MQSGSDPYFYRDNEAYNGDDEPKNLHDLQAEREFLAGLIQDGTRLSSLSDSVGLLSADEFASEKHRIIYEAILKKSAESDDFSTTAIRAFLENEGKLAAAGGSRYISDLLPGSSVSEKAFLTCAGIIRNMAKRRELAAVSEKIKSLCYAPKGRSVKDIFDEASGLVFKLAESVSQHDSGPQAAVPRAVQLMLDIQESKGYDDFTGIPTGFAMLDSITRGLQPGSLNIIAARPSVGKTSFAMNIVANIAMNPNIHKPALVFSLEMPTDQILMRLLSTFGRVSMNDLKDGKVQPHQWRDMVRKVKLLSEENEQSERTDKLYIDDSGDVTPLDIRTKARKLWLEHGGLSVIMIDYVQLMRPQSKAANRTLEIGEISRSLKLLAKELNVPIIALAQLNREVDNRKDHRPLNSDLRESGSLEQDADMIMFLHRDAVYGKAENGEDNSNQALLIIGKNRNGATADIDLLFIGEYTAFYDKDSPEGEAYSFADRPGGAVY